MQTLNPVGSPFPDITLPLLDGGTLRVADSRGTNLVLFMWGSW